MAGSIHIIIADDHGLFVEGLAMLLSTEKNITIQAIAKDGKELLDILPSKNPHVVLMDFNMPRLNGLETLKVLTTSYPLIKTIFLSTYNEPHIIAKVRLSGACGYLPKNCSRAELTEAIQTVYNGGSWFPQQHPQPKSGDEQDSFIKQFNLTKRELELLNYIKDGHTNAQMASVMFLSVYTIETHRKNIMQKLGLKSPAALMKFIIDNHL